MQSYEVVDGIDSATSSYLPTLVNFLFMCCTLKDCFAQGLHLPPFTVYSVQTRV